jgi:site-specific DNA-adenine methylase
MKILNFAVIGVVLIAVGSVRVSGGQIVPSNLNMSQPDSMRRAEQQRLRIAERQKKLAQDTDKLVALSNSLKEEVDEANKDILSLEMVKKAEQIEKLAHSVKERIKE